MDVLTKIFQYYKAKGDKRRFVNAESRVLVDDEYNILNMWCEGVDDLSFIYKKKEDIVHFYFVYHYRPELIAAKAFEDKLKEKFSENNGPFEEIICDKDLIEIGGIIRKKAINNDFLDEVEDYITNSEYAQTLAQIENNLIDIKERQFDDLTSMVEEGSPKEEIIKKIAEMKEDLNDEELVENATVFASYLLENIESRNTFLATLFRINRYKVNEALDVLKNMDVVFNDDDFGFTIRHNKITTLIHDKFKEEDIDFIKQLIRDEINHR